MIKIRVTPGSFWDQFWDALQPMRRMDRQVASLGGLMLRYQHDVRAANDKLQALVSDHGEAIPGDILKAISDLGHIVGSS